MDTRICFVTIDDFANARYWKCCYNALFFPYRVHAAAAQRQAREAEGDFSFFLSIG